MAKATLEKPPYGLRSSCVFPIGARTLPDLKGALGDSYIYPEPIASGGSAADLVLVVLPHNPRIKQDDDWPVWFRKAHEKLTRDPQVWVHPDNADYRAAYTEAARRYPVLRQIPNGRRTGNTFMKPILGAGSTLLPDIFIDHVMNRKLARRWNFELIRLRPVDRAVNTNAGSVYGIEVRTGPGADGGRWSRQWPEAPGDVIVADAADITKMMNLAPGTITEACYQVAEVQRYCCRPSPRPGGRG